MNVKRIRTWIRKYVIDGFRKMDETDLRWSYIVIGSMVVMGIVFNIFMPHGWTVWPFVLSVAILMLVHEAADRNTEELPLLRVYALFGVAMGVWVVTVFLMSAVNVFVVLAGFAAMAYQIARWMIRDRERKRLIAKRRMEGCCIYCGEPAGPGVEMCLNCGEEPDPDATRLKRVQGVMQSLRRTERLKAALAPDAPATVAAKKEQALLQRRMKGQGRLKR